MRRHTGDGQLHVVVDDFRSDAEVAAIALGIVSTGLLQAGGKCCRFVADQGGDRGRWNLVGGQATGHQGDFGTLALGTAPRKAGHDRTVTFFGNYHRVAAIERQVVVGRRVAFEVVGDGVAAGFLGGVYQQLEVSGQWQLLFLDHLHRVQRDDDAIFVILGAAAVHAVADQRDVERVELGAVLQYPVFRGHRHHIGMGMDADHFIAAAFEGDFIDAVVDVAEVQVEGLGQAFDLVGYLDELGVVVLLNAVDANGGDRHQLAQGFGGCTGVLHSRVEAEQAVDFVLLFSGQ
ncbi:hypothetical protein D3C77_355530 [compost metagenome]